MGKLESRNIEKYFTHDGKPLKTLDGINVNVEDGEFVCIVVLQAVENLLF